MADGLTMTIEFCGTFYSACSAQLGLEDNYCEVHTGGSETDQYWSYPLAIDSENPKVCHSKPHVFGPLERGYALGLFVSRTALCP